MSEDYQVDLSAIPGLDDASPSPSPAPSVDLSAIPAPPPSRSDFLADIQAGSSATADAEQKQRAADSATQLAAIDLRDPSQHPQGDDPAAMLAQMPHERLMASDRYRQVYNSAVPVLGPDDAQQYAKLTIAKQAHDIPYLRDSIFGDLMGMPGDAAFQQHYAPAPTPDDGSVVGGFGDQAPDFGTGGGQLDLAPAAAGAEQTWQSIKDATPRALAAGEAGLAKFGANVAEAEGLLAGPIGYLGAKHFAEPLREQASEVQQTIAREQAEDKAAGRGSPLSRFEEAAVGAGYQLPEYMLVPEAGGETKLAELAEPFIKALPASASAARDRYDELRSQGVGVVQALSAAGLTGVLNDLGGGVPLSKFGGALERTAVGAGTNVATTELGRVGQNAILSDRKDLQQEFSPEGDIQAALLGGGLAHVGGSDKGAERLQGAAARALDAVGDNPEAHARIAYALDQVQNGPKNAMWGVAEMQHIAKNGAARDEAAFQAWNDQRQATAVEQPSEAETATPEGRATLDQAQEMLAGQNPADITARFEQQLQDHDQATQDYAALPETQGGRVLNVDVARELSPDYVADRTQSAAVHEPASAFIKRLYTDKLSQPTPDGADPNVLFTAGGTGAGKTSGMQAAGDALGNPEMVYDTNMSNFASSKAKIDQALDAGRNVSVLYTYRDPVEAFRNGALPRAMRMEGELGSGRTVPVDEHVKTHVGASDTVRQLAQHYAGDERVQIHAIDNSNGPGNAKLAPLDSLPKVEENGLREKLLEQLDEAHANGEISDAIYAGFRNKSLGAERGGGDEQERQAPAARPERAAAEPAATAEQAAETAGGEADRAEHELPEGTSTRPGGELQRQARDVTSPLDAAAHEAATSPLNDKPQPTDAQARAGNYAKGHVRLQGLDISIENPRGSTRSGVDENGQPWTREMRHHYGYIKGTLGADGQHMDVMLGENPENPMRPVFVIRQKKADGSFDEHKVMLGFKNQRDAERAYRSEYPRGWDRMGDVQQMSSPDFKAWLKGRGREEAQVGIVPDSVPRVTLRNQQSDAVAMHGVTSDPTPGRVDAAGKALPALPNTSRAARNHTYFDDARGGAQGTHEAVLTNLYDLDKDPRGLVDSAVAEVRQRGLPEDHDHVATELERQIVQQGFDGYRTQGRAAVLGDDVPVSERTNVPRETIREGTENGNEQRSGADTTEVRGPAAERREPEAGEDAGRDVATGGSRENQPRARETDGNGETGQDDAGRARQRGASGAPGADTRARGADVAPAQAPPTGERLATRNADTEMLRARRSDEPSAPRGTKADADLEAGARAALEANPKAGEELAREVAAKPRPLTDHENAVLAMDRARLESERQAAVDRAVEAQRRGDEVGAAQAKASAQIALDAARLNDKAAESAGTEQGRAFRARQLGADQSMTLARMLNEAEVAKGSRLTPAEIAEFERLQAQHKAAAAQLEAGQAEQPLKRATPKATGTPYERQLAKLAAIAKKEQFTKACAL